MIPISGDQVLTHKDDESGIVYRFRPLLGDAEYAYYAAMAACSRNIDHVPFLGMAEVEVKEKNPGKTWEKGEFDAAVRQEAVKMAAQDSERTLEEVKAEMKALDDLIDALLIGWDAPEGVTVPAFSKLPSKLFRHRDKLKMFRVIMDLNSDLSGVEEKN